MSEDEIKKIVEAVSTGELSVEWALKLLLNEVRVLQPPMIISSHGDRVRV